MQLTTANSLIAAALVAGTLFSAPVQAQSSAVSQYKLAVDTTLVLGATTEAGQLRILNNGPANAEVRWFDPKAGTWDAQVLEAGESLLSERGQVVRISKDTLVCLLGQASKEKAGLRSTSGFYSMPLVPTPEDDKLDPKPDQKKASSTAHFPSALCLQPPSVFLTELNSVKTELNFEAKKNTELKKRS